jgi:ribosomal protein S18 acetylase RimI-like enzyme
MMDISRRPATTDDEAFLFALYCDTRAEELAAWQLEKAQVEMVLRLQFSARQQSYEYQFVGAEHSIVLCGDRPIGRILVDKSAEAFHLVDIALLGEFRGSGVGRGLLQELLAEAARERKPVRLHVEQSNRAVHLYERLGFVKVADSGAYTLMERASREET